MPSLATAIAVCGMAIRPRNGATPRPDGDPRLNRASAVPEKSASGYDVRSLSKERIEQLAAKLSPEERHVILHQGTERPFCGTLLNNKASGLYACRLCGLPLFKADAK